VNEEELVQQTKDEEHLRLLSIGYKVSAGVAALASLYGPMFALMGFFYPTSTQANVTTPTQPAFVDSLFVGIGLSILAVGLGIAALDWTVARRIKQRRSIGFCQVVAALTCLAIPFGTGLGVLTFIVLSRDSVRQLFEQAQAARLA
jgi:hypothetical protein